MVGFCSVAIKAASHCLRTFDFAFEAVVCAVAVTDGGRSFSSSDDDDVTVEPMPFSNGLSGVCLILMRGNDRFLASGVGVFGAVDIVAGAVETGVFLLFFTTTDV